MRSICSLLAALLAVATTSVALSNQPNIIYILADDLGYGELSCFGQTRFATPHLDRMAREGIIFTHHYAGSPICAPSRNTLMTGEHTGHVTVRNNFVFGAEAGERVPLGPDDITIAERLRAAGYTTAMFGKWGLGEDGSGAEPWNKGWDEFYGFVNQKHAHNQYPEFLYRNAQPEPLVPNYGHFENVFANDRFTEEAESFLDQQSESQKPFFLYLAYTTPHSDLKCPQDSIDQARAKHPELTAPGAPESALVFAAMVMRLDRDVGRLLAKLNELDLDDDTLVIFTSDNGPHAEGGKDDAANTYFNASGGLRGMKRDLYEGGIRVPFIARWPGKIAPNTTSAHPSASWDFAATSLDLAGVTADNLPPDGISYAPKLLGRTQDQASHDYLYWELVFKNEGRQAIRQGDWKAVRYGVDAPIEIYHLATDVGEQNDIAHEQPKRRDEFAHLFTSAREPDPRFPLRFPADSSSRQP